MSWFGGSGERRDGEAPRGLGTRVVVPLALGGAFLALTWLESRRPLRRRREPQAPRVARNATMGALAAVAAASLEPIVLRPLARRVESRRLGLLQILPLPPAIRTVAGVLLLDYTLWWWHWLNHRDQFLWRFHSVHHADLDMDASTALRFHFGEMFLSVFYRAAQLRILGVDRRTASIWQFLLFIAIFFHHSNLRLPEGLDRALSRIVVTPRMHGIHHSIVMEEMNSNWSSIFSAFDFLHGTFREEPPNETLSIGIAECREREDVTIGKMLVGPFEHEVLPRSVAG